MPASVLRRALLALMVLARPATLGAQQRFEITSYAGGYIPTTKLGIIQLRLAGTPTSLEAEAATAAGLGARLGFWGNGRLAVEASYFYSKPKLRSTTGFLTQTVEGTVQSGSLVAMYRVTGGQTGTDLVIKGGIVGINHGGPGFQLASGQFDLGGTVGAGLRMDLSRTATFRIDGETFLYSWSPGPAFNDRFQTDVVMSAGLALRLGR
ncbi:MAG: hypothetical protein ABI647_07790 [Gemmatimonadota bacterium]